MTQINHIKLEDFFKERSNALPSLFLLYGDSYITREKADFIVSKLISEKEKELCYTLFQNDAAHATDIVEELSTFSVFMDKKVVFAKEIDFLKDDLKLLSDYMADGIPDNNYLIISLKKIDKRSSFYKTIKSNGLVVDCSVPGGLGKRDLQLKSMFLKGEMDKILKKNHKEITIGAFNRLVDLTGFNPVIFRDNLEKLISFTGQRNKIIEDDISKLIQRTKIDPVFDFTSAFSNKDLKKALFLLSSLLKSQFHILQILKALTNHIRKLYAAKCFLDYIVNHFFENNKKIWNKNTDFNSFNTYVVPAIKKGDKELQDELGLWHGDLSDFSLASKSKSNYPEYQIFKKSNNFTMDELEKIIIDLAELDFKFKSSSQDEIILFKDFMFRRLT